MGRILIAWLAAGVVFIAGDISWITLTGEKLYRPFIGSLLADRVDFVAGGAFYLVYLTGIVLFAVAPWRADRTAVQAMGWGALLGLVAYGTYDLTNQATMKLWATSITLWDMGWGALITALASGAGRLAGSLSTHR